MKIYVASSWRNSHQSDVVALLRAAGHDAYDFRNPPDRTGFAWRQVAPDYSGGKVGVEHYRQMLAHPIAEAGFNSDEQALIEADAVVYVLECGKSASWELGFAMGMGTPAVVYWPGEHEPELMFRRATIAGSLDEVLAAVAAIDASRHDG